MAIFGPQSGTWSREQGSQDATVLGPGTGPRACCLSLSSGPIASCPCDLKRGKPCSMPELPRLYRAVRARCVSTHNRCVRPCTGPRGPPAASCPHQGNTALAGPEAAAHQPDRALSGRAQDKQRRVLCAPWVASGGPVCAGPRVPDPGAQPGPGIPHAAWKGLSVHMSAICSLLPVRPEGSMLVSLGHSVSPASSPGPSTH